MKIFFITEYFYPYVHGGAEISVYELAKKLNDLKNEVYVLTPNYGSLKNEIVDTIRVVRFPFPIHFKTVSSQLSPSYHANPIMWLYLAGVIIWQNRKINADIFHAQTVNVFPAVWIASRILGKKCVVNIRDNQILCNYGWCLSQNNGKTCSLRQYFLDDFKHYYLDTLKRKNTFMFFLNLIFSILGRFRVVTLKFFINRADERICGSDAQRETLAINGILAHRIYNIFEFPKKFDKRNPKKEVLYATKLSEGKGLSLLLRSWVSINKKFPELKLRIIGNGDRKFYENLATTLGISTSVIFENMPSYTDIRTFRQNMFLEVTPSIYPESFGRAALEAIALGVPVVTSNRGGLKEIVEDGVTGYVVDPNEKQLTEAIIKAIKNNTLLRKNIASRYQLLKNKFETEPVKQYLKLYKSLL